MSETNEKNADDLDIDILDVGDDIDTSELLSRDKQSMEELCILFD